MPDLFPEAFERFERDVDVSSFSSYLELMVAFKWWSGKRWKGTHAQRRALRIEARRLARSFPKLEFNRSMTIKSGKYSSRRHGKERAWRLEAFKMNGYSLNRYRDLRTGRFIKKPI